MYQSVVKYRSAFHGSKMTSSKNITYLFVAIRLSRDESDSTMELILQDNGEEPAKMPAYKIFTVDTDKRILHYMPDLSSLTKLTTVNIKSYNNLEYQQPILYSKLLRNATSIKTLFIDRMIVVIEDPRDIALPNLETVTIQDCSIHLSLYMVEDNILRMFLDYSPNIRHIDLYNSNNMSTHHIPKDMIDRLCKLSYLRINKTELIP